MFEWNSAYPQRELNQGDSLVSPIKYLYKPARKNFDRYMSYFSFFYIKIFWNNIIAKLLGYIMK